ncbi:non-hydrolyzing UDP-N-acetylglucosamine 2-epimerase [Aquirufa ecclesiirivi]|uniref:non-hydrolyzing UDP-N-acetylglucosamine 2-epimerase n=1 Tax=Aquirufa ecclesiirivi TaxID=2715124 RepID=UPI00140A6D2E|nr:UDP-N-acetylglucosamine 2-epimerase (non-hydrolyzing) [Aquirufa ecclesiirivi]NHC48161.1 UDP-N-acetylglucosamine 2-epimerase (non-hydrolyzing) [Aquirufa ecclesiirivi]
MSKLKLVTVLGTRPEIIRLAEIIKLADQVFEHTLVHTGQNYDYNLNEVFFNDLGLREPDHFLGVVGDDLGETIGNIISKTYKLFKLLKPDALLVLGDTNSVLCTISAKRLKIPIFHMESGNRCFDQNVPEETNRKISDHISDINLTYTENSRRYLLSEGFRKDHVFVTGSPLYEVLLKFDKEINQSSLIQDLNLKKGSYFVVSAHREENIDIESNFINLVDAINHVAKTFEKPIIFSTHPRTKNIIEKRGLQFHPNIKLHNPFGFFDYVNLQKNSFCVLSDSGTISEESAMVGFPAVSIRTSTERPEAIEAGSIVLGGITRNEIENAINVIIQTNQVQMEIPNEYKIKNVSTKIVRIIQGYTNVVNKVIWDK